MDVEIGVRGGVVVAIRGVEISGGVAVKHHAETLPLVGGRVGGKHVLGQLELGDDIFLRLAPYLVADFRPVKDGLVGMGNGESHVVGKVGTCHMALLYLPADGCYRLFGRELERGREPFAYAAHRGIDASVVLNRGDGIGKQLVIVFVVELQGNEGGQVRWGDMADGIDLRHLVTEIRSVNRYSQHTPRNVSAGNPSRGKRLHLPVLEIDK